MGSNQHRGHSWRVRLAKQETLTSPGYLVSPLVSRGPWISTVVLYCCSHSDSASVLLYFTFLSHFFPLPCGVGSKVSREGFDSSVIMPFFLVCWGCDTSYIVSVHIQCQATIYTLSFCRGHSWPVRLAKQETLTPPWHLVSPFCRGLWKSTVVLYCWCHSDSASFILYFTGKPGSIVRNIVRSLSRLSYLCRYKGLGYLIFNNLSELKPPRGLAASLISSKQKTIKIGETGRIICITSFKKHSYILFILYLHNAVTWTL